MGGRDRRRHRPTGGQPVRWSDSPCLHGYTRVRHREIRWNPLISVEDMSPSASRTRIWLALWVVYLVWGSTYLAIRIAVHPTHGEGLPPLLLAGSRFTVAGLVMLAVTVRRPAPDGRANPLTRRVCFAAAAIGIALPFGGNGLVSIAERHI